MADAAFANVDPHGRENSAFLGRLRSRLGEKHVVTDADEVAPFTRELRGLYQGSAFAIVRPGNTAEVAFVLGECSRAGVPVVPQGGRTGLVGGGVPSGGLILSLARLNRVRAVDAVNASMIVEAGCILQTIHEAAAAHGCLFPLSLASEGSCQIGGVLSTNAGGTAVVRYGNARELVLGLEVVLADGSVLNGLSRLRKDNTGYDLKNLFIGAEGTLGIITAAVLKLFPLPKEKATAFIGCASARDALALFARLRGLAGDELTAFEYMPRPILDMALRNLSGTTRPLRGDHEAYALIELTSPRAGADLSGVLEECFGAALEDGLIGDATIAASEAQSRSLWELRERLWEAQLPEGASIKHDVSVPVSSVADFIACADAACREALPDVRILAFGHFGDGNVHYNLGQPAGLSGEAFTAMTPRFNRIVHDAAARFEGSISAEHGIGLSKRAELLIYKDPVALGLMHRIKNALDPGDIMNPGKVLPSPGAGP